MFSNADWLRHVQRHSRTSSRKIWRMPDSQRFKLAVVSIRLAEKEHKQNSKLLLRPSLGILRGCCVRMCNRCSFSSPGGQSIGPSLQIHHTLVNMHLDECLSGGGSAPSVSTKPSKAVRGPAKVSANPVTTNGAGKTPARQGSGPRASHHPAGEHMTI